MSLAIAVAASPSFCPESLRDDRLPIGVDGSVPAQNAGQQDARAVSVRHIGNGAQLMTDPVAGAPINTPKARSCKPNCKLAVEPTIKIGWI